MRQVPAPLAHTDKLDRIGGFWRSSTGSAADARRTACRRFLRAVSHGSMPEPPFAQEALPPLLDVLGSRGVDHVGVVGRDLLVQPLRGMGEQVSMLVHRAPLCRHAFPDGSERLLEPRRAVHDDELGPAQARPMRSSRTARQASVVSPPMCLTASSTFWPSTRTPIATRSEIAVALRSSRTRTAVPSRISRTIGSSWRERASKPPSPSSPSATPG